MNESANDIEVTLEPVLTEESQFLILVTFKNDGLTPYFLDKKLAFYEGRYTLDCLIIMQNNLQLKRKMKFKIKASEFPYDYIEIPPGEMIDQQLDLQDHFRIIGTGPLTVQYHYNTLDPITKAMDEFWSQTITLANK
jgi:hypothetical protein